MDTFIGNLLLGIVCFLNGYIIGIIFVGPDTHPPNQRAYKRALRKALYMSLSGQPDNKAGLP